jgi:hypothetical protein
MGLLERFGFKSRKQQEQEQKQFQIEGLKLKIAKTEELIKNMTSFQSAPGDAEVLERHQETLARQKQELGNLMKI